MERWNLTGGGNPSRTVPIFDTGYCFAGGGSVGLERGQHCGDRALLILLVANNSSIVHLKKLWMEGFSSLNARSVCLMPVQPPTLCAFIIFGPVLLAVYIAQHCQSRWESQAGASDDGAAWRPT